MTLLSRFLSRNKQRTQPETVSPDSHEEVERPPGMSDQAYGMYAQLVNDWRQDPEGHARRAAAVRQADEYGWFEPEFNRRILEAAKRDNHSRPQHG